MPSPFGYAYYPYGPIGFNQPLLNPTGTGSNPVMLPNPSAPAQWPQHIPPPTTSHTVPNATPQMSMSAHISTLNPTSISGSVQPENASGHTNGGNDIVEILNTTNFFEQVRLFPKQMPRTGLMVHNTENRLLEILKQIKILSKVNGPGHPMAM